MIQIISFAVNYVICYNIQLALWMLEIVKETRKFRIKKECLNMHSRQDASIVWSMDTICRNRNIHLKI